MSTMNHKQRVSLIERESLEVPLTQQAALLNVSRSSLYYQPCEPPASEIAIKHWIDELYTQYPIYGSRKMEAQLRREGVVINRKRRIAPTTVLPPVLTNGPTLWLVGLVLPVNHIRHLTMTDTQTLETC